MYIYKTVLEDGVVGFIGTTKNKSDFELQLVKGVRELYYLELDLPKGDVYCLVGHFISEYDAIQNKNRKGWGKSKLIPSEYIDGLEWIKYESPNLSTDDKMVAYYLVVFTNDIDGLYNIWCYKNSLELLEDEFIKSGYRLNRGLNKLYYKEFPNLKDAMIFRTKMHYNDYIFNVADFEFLGEYNKENSQYEWYHLTYKKPSYIVFDSIFTYDELLEVLEVDRKLLKDYSIYSVINKISTDLNVTISSGISKSDEKVYYKIGVKK